MRELTLLVISSNVEKSLVFYKIKKPIVRKSVLSVFLSYLAPKRIIIYKNRLAYKTIFIYNCLIHKTTLGGVVMDKQRIMRVMADNLSFAKRVTYQKRDIDLSGDLPYIFVGIRRSGKTYLLYQKMHELVEYGKDWNDFVYINFEDERLIEFKVDDFDLLIECHYMKSSQKPIFFLDEIQNVIGWEKFARRLADQKYQVYLTGSNAKMLSAEMATTLGGRYLIKEVYPYSFSEYLFAQQIDLTDINYYVTKDRGTLLQYFANYFVEGGFAELINFENKRDYLTSIYQKIYLSDMMLRNHITNKSAVELLMKKLAESVGQRISYSRLTNVVKSTGTKLGKSTTIQYIDYAIESRLIFKIENYYGKLAEKVSAAKYYFADNGLLNLFLIDAETALLENIVAIHLLKNPSEELYFYQDNIEIDFYLPNQATAIQVCYNISDIETYNREVQALCKFNAYKACQRLIIVTYDEEDNIMVENNQIEVIPAWKFLL